MKTLDLTEAAALLKVHPKTLQRLAQSGAVPACKVGRVWVFIDDLLFQLLMALYRICTFPYFSAFVKTHQMPANPCI
jgi:excisionase family DNA binding protein